jgi:phytoene/squalene synthetase
MDKIELYNQVCFENSATITSRYSTSFASAIRLLAPRMRGPICSIYGFVRIADEIVDSFHQLDQVSKLREFKKDTLEAIENRFSLNPVLHAFQLIVHQFQIDVELILSFFKSMEMDLEQTRYETYTDYSNYIYGSAEVVGLMCLPILCDQQTSTIAQLITPAKALGAAFQKINFLRDLQEDYHELKRVYFPNIDFENLDDEQKKTILQEIEADFKNGLAGIKQLPIGSRFGVYVAYRYYYSLKNKIAKLPASVIKTERVRIPDSKKLIILIDSYIRFQLNAI